ncbi:hypothetical protein ACTFIW_009091, partial [Dictyostelium discoideum]
IGRYYS